MAVVKELAAMVGNTVNATTMHYLTLHAVVILVGVWTH